MDNHDSGPPAPPSPPSAVGVPPMPPPELPPLKRPASAETFGIMNLIFGIGGPIFAVWGQVTQMIQANAMDTEIPEMSLGLSVFYWITYLGLAAWLIVSGRKLLKVTLDCRTVFRWYCIASLIIRPVSVFLMIPFIGEAFRLGAEMEMQNQPQRNDPDFDRFMEQFMAMAETIMIVVMLVWSVAYELVGLLVINRKKTAAAYERYQARKGITA